MSKHRIKLLLPIFLFLFINIVIIFNWFHQGFMYGGGDSGLPMFNPDRLQQDSVRVWWESIAPGSLRPQGIASQLIQIYYVLLSRFGLSAVLLQALTFSLLIFSMGIGMYVLALEFLGNSSRRTAFLAGFYYMVNPYVMVQIWHRFIYTGIFLAAGLPFIFIFWKRWLDKRSFLNLVLFLITNLIFSDIFSTLAYALTLWLLITLYTLYKIFIPWIGKYNFFILSGQFIIGIILWVLINSWWVLPVIKIAPQSLVNQHSLNSSLLTFLAISKQAIIPYTIVGLNSFYLYENQELGLQYSNLLFLFIPWIGIIFIFLGMSFSTKNNKHIFLILLFIFSVFLSKGNSPPFGSIFTFLFSKFFILGVLRNPFEKIGLLIPFAGSILFAIGFVKFIDILRRRNHFLAIFAGFLLIILFFGIYHMPFWTGSLFGRYDRTGKFSQSYFELPKEYNQANDWIKSQNQSGNILHLPINTSEALTYNWDYRYNGVEISSYIFTSNPSISMGFNIPSIDETLKALRQATVQFGDNKDIIRNLFRALNVRFIVLHYDIDWKKSGISNPDDVVKIIDKLDFIQKKQQFNNLVIYELNEDNYLDKLYLTDSFNVLQSGNVNDKAFWLDKSKIFISDINNDTTVNLLGGKEKLIVSTSVITNPPTELISADDALKDLPVVRFLPDSPFYVLIQLKEKLHLISNYDVNSVTYMNYASKRLVESYLLEKKGSFNLIGSIMERYIFNIKKSISSVGQFTPTELFRIRRFYENHLAILKQMKLISDDSTGQILDNVIDVINQELIHSGIKELFPLISDAKLPTPQRLIYRFLVPEDSNYEILLSDFGTSSFYPDNLKSIVIQIDNNISSRVTKKNDNFLSLGKVWFSKGKHEISYNIINSLNLVNSTEDKSEIGITSSVHTEKILDLKTKNVYPDSNYNLSFDYWLQKGTNPLLSVKSDSDPKYDVNIDIYNFYGQASKIGQSNYNYYWNNYSNFFQIPDNSQELSVKILITPWNDCEALLAYNKKLCDIKEVRSSYERPSTVIFKNIALYRLLDNPLFLKSDTIAGKESRESGKIQYTKTGLLRYQGKLVVESPELLVFSESYHNDWVLKLYDGQNKEIIAQKHFIANLYGNSWYIEKPGSYSFTIEFVSQKNFRNGIYLSLGTGILCIFGCIISLIQRKKNDKSI